jgi:nitroimidazol reductase NimA-like FMN-containing flavoprotein (pyridoxamine 5'-phosphate oxidase superfamily)
MDSEELRARLGDAVVAGEAAMAAMQVLTEASVGYLAMAGGGWPYVVPIAYAYDGATVFFHGAGSLKSSLLEVEPRVCLAVTTQPELMIGDGPCDDNFRYESVLVFGEVELLDDDDERYRALRVIVEKYDAAARSASFKPSTFAGTRVYALRVEALTYKRNPPE